MTLRALVATFLIVPAVAIAAEKAPFQSATANNALATYRDSLEKAGQKYNRDATQARERFVRQLKLSLAGETRAGNLDEANVIQAAIDELESLAPGVEHEPHFTMATALAGEWSVQYIGGSKQRFAFDGRNGVRCVANGKTYDGKLIERNGDWWIDFADNDANRVSLATGGRIFIEHWRGKADGPSHAVAVGVPVQP